MLEDYEMANTILARLLQFGGEPGLLLRRFCQHVHRRGYQAGIEHESGEITHPECIVVGTETLPIGGEARRRGFVLHIVVAGYAVELDCGIEFRRDAMIFRGL